MTPVYNTTEARQRKHPYLGLGLTLGLLCLSTGCAIVPYPPGLHRAHGGEVVIAPPAVLVAPPRVVVQPGWGYREHRRYYRHYH